MSKHKMSLVTNKSLLKNNKKKLCLLFTILRKLVMKIGKQKCNTICNQCFLKLFLCKVWKQFYGYDFVNQQ